MSEISDAESFVSLAEAHGVVGHLGTTFAAFSGPQIPSSFVGLLRTRQRAHALSSLAMAAQLFRILEIVQKSAIECVVVKGPVLSLRAYGDLSARQYADLDLLLRQRYPPAQLRFWLTQATILEFPSKPFEATKFRVNIASVDKSAELFWNYILNSLCATFLHVCRSKNIFSVRLGYPSTGA